MSDSRLNMPEWDLQPLFSKLLIAGAFLLLGSDVRGEWPDRMPRPSRVAALQLERVQLPAEPGSGMRVTGAWRLTSDDDRVFGLSGLAVLPGGRLQALTDSGVLVTFDPPGGAPRASIRELAAGPGPPTFKRFRDSEALEVEPNGDRLIAFENQHSLWRYPAAGGAAQVRIALPSTRWKKNTGIEAIVRDRSGGALLLLHEGGRQLFHYSGSPVPLALGLEGATGGVADAALLPDGRIIVAVREIGILGLTNRLAWLERSGRGYRLRNFATLPLGPVDNVEGLATESLPDGRTQLWAVTDNDGWRRTLLLQIELDTTKAPANAGA
jgi:hypothetical protein